MTCIIYIYEGVVSHLMCMLCTASNLLKISLYGRHDKKHFTKSSATVQCHVSYITQELPQSGIAVSATVTNRQAHAVMIVGHSSLSMIWLLLSQSPRALFRSGDENALVESGNKTVGAVM